MYGLTFKLPLQKKNMSERSEILEQLYVEYEKNFEPFYMKGEKKIKAKKLDRRGFAVKLAPHSIDQLYFLKSICSDYKNRGGDYNKCLWGSIKVKK